MQKYENGITIFTPTYNRADKLKRLYESLLIQDNKNFEWLIVDDGSTDGTRKLIETFMGENNIDIRYIYKSNGGKHTALNMGMHNANKEYFFCIDSDDFLAENAVSNVIDCINKFHPDGIIAYKSELGKSGIIGDEFPQHLQYSTLWELSNKYFLKGDKLIIHRTELLEDIYIPEPKGVKFFPEAYMFDIFDAKYSSFLLRKSICICEYLCDGYSENYSALLINNAVSFKWSYAQRIDLANTFKERFTYAFKYDAFSMLARSDEGKYKGKHRAILVMAFPLGLAMYMVYLMRKRKM